MNFSRFFSACWGDHAYIRERDADGKLLLRCSACGHERTPLQGQAVIGPAHQQARDRGARTMKAKRVKDNRITFPERQSQR